MWIRYWGDIACSISNTHINYIFRSFLFTLFWFYSRWGIVVFRWFVYFQSLICSEINLFSLLRNYIILLIVFRRISFCLKRTGIFLFLLKECQRCWNTLVQNVYTSVLWTTQGFDRFPLKPLQFCLLAPLLSR